MQTASVVSQETSRKGSPGRRERYRRNWRQRRHARKLAEKTRKETDSVIVDIPKPIVLTAGAAPVDEAREMVSRMGATPQLWLPAVPAFPEQYDVVEVLVRECGCKTVTCLTQGNPEACGCDIVGSSCSGCKDAHFNIPCRGHKRAHIRDFSVLTTKTVRRYQ